MKNFEYLLFDLDGTLTASAEGIVNSVIYALKKNGIEETDREKLLAFVGPPLIDSFEKYYGMNREQAKKLAEDYREYFRERGWKENAVYEGIPEVLAQLKADGKHLILATAKPEPFARQIMEYFDLTKYFELICGSTFDGRITQKGEVIASVIEQIGAEHKAQMLMIGDREHDVNGAAENGIPCMGVLYGYGDREELTNAGALILCPDVQSIPEMISKLGDW
jgi:phosphoglycolate phosphatase